VLKVDFVAFFFLSFWSVVFLVFFFFLNFEIFLNFERIVNFDFFCQIFHNKKTITSSNSLNFFQNQNNHGLSLIVSKTSKLKKKFKIKKNHGL
jgi:hypothetical protein